MLSNAATGFIKSLYADYRIDVIRAPRSISANGKRGCAEEVLVRNY